MKLPFWPFKQKPKLVEQPQEYYWKIIYWVYPEDRAAKEGFGIVFDNRGEGKPYWRWNSPPIFGYMTWKAHGDTNPVDLLPMSLADLNREPRCIAEWHVEEHPSQEVIETLKHCIQLRNIKYRKLGGLDNLSAIEILSKLNEYKE